MPRRLYPFPPALFATNWLRIHDGNPAAAALFSRHYSRYVYADGRQPKKIIGPGEYILLITPELDAIFAWRKFRDASGQSGINCSIFRNESRTPSSVLILDAEQWATTRWPQAAFYTFVNPRLIKSTNPGYCFKLAGWYKVGLTKKRKLIILRKDSYL